MCRFWVQIPGGLLSISPQPRLSDKMELAYLTAECGLKNYIYDSRTKQKRIYDKIYRGKREILLDYLAEQDISQIIALYEYALPEGRSQLVCWFYYTPVQNEMSSTEPTTDS